jgi:hypothetical protein
MAILCWAAKNSLRGTDPNCGPCKQKQKFKKILVDTDKWSQKQQKKGYLARLTQNLSFKV